MVGLVVVLCEIGWFLLNGGFVSVFAGLGWFLCGGGVAVGFFWWVGFEIQLVGFPYQLDFVFV